MESTSPSSDWIELLRGLNAADAKFLIVGAHALSLYAAPRATGDLDIWIERSKENAGRVYRAIADFGAPLGDLTVQELQGSDCIFMFGRPPVRVDILTDISGVSFEVRGQTKDSADLEALDLEAQDNEEK